ncbi:nucleotidyltransferase domain-containing protein [Thalassobacillus hwangdonensis]|uniref:Nucleotidyltransferase domain-containing protein n=1 Tax=Thalassobacillus hwangdonensis TaxID=546108 RepID=A0ABW3L4Z0_9BACI
MEQLLVEIKDYLIESYDCHTIILYGSYSSGDYTEESDIDLLCFAERTAEKNDVAYFNGKQLDVWVYGSEKLKQPDQFLRVNGGKVLLDQKGLAGEFLHEVEQLYQKGPVQMPEEEKSFLKSWLWKMYRRSQKGDLEGNYRLHWMLKDALELYFEFKGEWFRGPKKSFLWLEEHDSEAYERFATVYQPGAGEEEVEALLRYLERL